MPPEKTKTRTRKKTSNRKTPGKTAPESDMRAALKEIALAIENPDPIEIEGAEIGIPPLPIEHRPGPDASVEAISAALAHRSLGEGGIAGIDLTDGNAAPRTRPQAMPNGGYDISRKVLARIASLAAQEIDGHEPPQRHALERIVDSIQGRSDGIRVEAGATEAAVDMLIRVHYGSHIPDLASRLRERIARRILEMTGLKVVEVNLRIQDVTPCPP